MLKNLRPQHLLPHLATEHSINHHIAALHRTHRFREALQAFDHLRANTHFAVWPSTYAHLVSSCSHLKSLALGRTVSHHLLRTIQPDLTLLNHLLNMYGKCGAPEDAHNLFDQMTQRNVVSWTAMISGYTQNGKERDGVGMYVGMKRDGVVPDQFALLSVMRACGGLGDVELGRQLHAEVVKSDSGAALIPQNALVSMYSNFGLVEDAGEVFDRIGDKDLVSWGLMIGGSAQRGDEYEALRLFKEMLLRGCYVPNEFIFGSVFSACSGVLESEYGSQVHGLSVKFGLGKDAYAGCSLCDMYAKCGRLELAKKVFSQIEKPDLVAWNAIIAAFAYSGNPNESMLLFSQLRLLGFLPDEITIRCLLCSFTSFVMLYQGKQVHAYVIKRGMDSDVPVCNTLLTMYTHCSDLSDVFNIFNEMTCRVDLVTWNAILTACLRHNQTNDACRLLKLMHSSQYKLDQITLANMLSVCSQLASIDMTYQVHDYSIKSGYEAETCVANGLIDTYSKCGSLSDARKFFESMGNPDVVSWSSLIVGYAQIGYGEEALMLFKALRNMGIKPNHVTFVGVLSACSHVGLVEEGCHYFRTMETEYGVIPTREHYSCVIDMLARAGYLKEAENLINQMPFEPDIVAWKSLLAACRTRKDVDVGKRAAESVLVLDPSNSAAHVLLCNIYASKGSWDDVARIRKSMRNEGVRKVPGQSWIEVRDGVHVFSVEDRSHPKMDEIYSVLEELWLKITRARTGGILDQNIVSVESLQE